jgi:hypothetical protein
MEHAFDNFHYPCQFAGDSRQADPGTSQIMVKPRSLLISIRDVRREVLRTKGRLAGSGCKPGLGLAVRITRDRWEPIGTGRVQSSHSQAPGAETHQYRRE